MIARLIPESKMDAYSGLPILEKKQTNQIILPTAKFQSNNARMRAEQKFRDLH